MISCGLTQTIVAVGAYHLEELVTLLDKYIFGNVLI